MLRDAKSGGQPARGGAGAGAFFYPRITRRGGAATKSLPMKKKDRMSNIEYRISNVEGREKL